MTTFSARIIEDSINPAGCRLTTFLLVYPRFLLCEVNTHRTCSRSTASSRAIPIAKRIKSVLENPVIPVWGKNKKGMQAEELLEDRDQKEAEEIWLSVRDAAVEGAQKLQKLGVHKQAANRLLEPFCHASTVLSATEWANFFALRWHKDAAPEFKLLADEMVPLYREHKPAELDWGQWHLPFVTQEERSDPFISIDDLIKCSVARCARTSYENHENRPPDFADEESTFSTLINNFPLHSSPGEHPAYACDGRPPYSICNHGNYRLECGWHQFRKTLKNENITKFPWDAEVPQGQSATE